ncbi:MAG: acetyl ornithine aminotransferase family protein [Anaerolineae bacterium]|nr:acetyl ornithine aminotransferase family protein [Anaerolineae bacterium]
MTTYDLQPHGAHATRIIEEDHSLLSPSNTRAYPLVVSHARGSELWDVDGNRYIDMVAGIAVTATGHCHPEVVAAIKEQADRFLHVCLSDFYYETAVELARKLADIAPFKENARVFFTNSGTETVEAALKLARYATGRPRMLAFLGSFHGRSMGALSLTSSKYRQQQGFAPGLPGVTHVPYPNPFRPILQYNRFDDYGKVVVDYIENVLFATNVPASEVAAVFVEPIQGEGGYIVPPPGFLPALRRLCDNYGILLVVDEIQSGLGRTGKWWAVEHSGIEPDMVLTAKGLASGMPLGALIARESLMQWEPGSHGSTFGGNPVSCAAALATLRLIENGMMDNAARMGEHILSVLKGFQERYSIVGDVRGRGLMLGIEIITPDGAPAPHLRDEIVGEAYRQKLLIFGCGPSSVRLMPALNLDATLAEEALDTLDRTLDAIQKSIQA